MTIIDKYFYRIIGKYSFYSLLALTAIFCFFKFIDELSIVGERDYLIDIAASYVFLLLPSIANSLLVLAIFIGTIFAIAELNSNKEIQIFYSGSISTKTIILKALRFDSAFIICLIVLFELISPISMKYAEQIKNESLGKSVGLDNGDFWLKKNNQFFLIEKESSSHSSVLIFEIQDNINLVSQTISPYGEFSEQQLLLKNIHKNNFNIVDNRYFVSRTELNKDTIDIDEEQIRSFDVNSKTLSLFGLIKIIFFSAGTDQNMSEYFLETLNRIIKPMLLVGMVLIAIPFILDTNRKASISNRMLLALSISLITHLMTKLLSIITLTFGFLVYLAPIIPAVILTVVGFFLVNSKLKENNL